MEGENHDARKRPIHSILRADCLRASIRDSALLRRGCGRCVKIGSAHLYVVM